MSEEQKLTTIQDLIDFLQTLPEGMRQATIEPLEVEDEVGKRVYPPHVIKADPPNWYVNQMPWFNGFLHARMVLHIYWDHIELKYLHES